MNLLERNGLLAYQDFIDRVMIASRMRASQLNADGGSTAGELQLAGKIMRLPYEWAKVVAVGVVCVDHPNLGDGSNDDPVGPNDEAFKYTVNNVIDELAVREVVPA
jgi:hypothetical protein